MYPAKFFKDTPLIKTIHSSRRFAPCYMEVSPSYEKLLIGYYKETTSIQIWDITKWKFLKTLTLPRASDSCKLFSDNILMFVDKHKRTITLLDINTGKDVHSFKLDMYDIYGIQHLVPLRDKKILASCFSNGRIKLWNIDTHMQHGKTLQKSQNIIESLMCSQLLFNGNLASILFRYENLNRTQLFLRIWDVVNEDCLEEILLPYNRLESQYYLQELPDKKLIVKGGTATWVCEVGSKKKSVPDCFDTASSVCWHILSNEMLIMITPSLEITGMNTNLQLWNIKANKIMLTFQVCSNEKTSVIVKMCMLPRYGILVSVSTQGTIQFWNVQALLKQAAENSDKEQLTQVPPSIGSRIL